MFAWETFYSERLCIVWIKTSFTTNRTCVSSLSIMYPAKVSLYKVMSWYTVCLICFEPHFLMWIKLKQLCCISSSWRTHTCLLHYYCMYSYATGCAVFYTLKELRSSDSWYWPGTTLFLLECLCIYLSFIDLLNIKNNSLILLLTSCFDSLYISMNFKCVSQINLYRNDKTSVYI